MLSKYLDVNEYCINCISSEMEKDFIIHVCAIVLEDRRASGDRSGVEVGEGEAEAVCVLRGRCHVLCALKPL